MDCWVTSSQVPMTCATPAVFLVVTLAVVLPIDSVTMSSFTPKPSQNPSTPPQQQYRLPDTLSPISYNITLWPRLEADERGRYIFTGRSTVVFECVKETDIILLHSDKLDLDLINDQLAFLSTLDGTPAPSIFNSWYKSDRQYIGMELNGTLIPGKSYQLHTRFKGELAEDLTGFYRAYCEECLQTKVIAASLLQPTYAREVFPCFDEPSLKAVFHVIILHDHGTVALSNGMEIGVKNVTVDGRVVLQTTFEPTMTMSTYLLAFIVCDYSYIKSQEISHVLVRLWANQNFIVDHYGDFVLNLTVDLLSQLESTFASTYPVSKYDQVALPEFSPSPMENWGLVTYKASVLWYDPKFSTHEEKEWTIVTVAHELVHAWFGNLVTLKWWNDLWLNEGFATYFSYLLASKLEPDMELLDMMLLVRLQEVMIDDAKVNSQPMSPSAEEVQSPDQIERMFTSTSDSKGAIVLHMLSNILSEEVFMQGVRTYLKQFAFKNVEVTDFWKHLQNAVDASASLTLPVPIGDIMNCWIFKNGYPVVTIDTTSGSIHQERFLSNPDFNVHRSTAIYNCEWIIPISWMMDGQEHPKVWLLNKTAEHAAMRTEKCWVLANLNMSGYYRVNYDLANWNRLISQLNSNHEEIPKVDRARIIDDAFSLARANRINFTLALGTSRYLSKETELMPLEAFLKHINYFLDMFKESRITSPMLLYLKKQVKPLFEHFGNVSTNWTSIPQRHTDKYAQAKVMALACKVGLEECKQLATTWYQQWMRKPDTNLIHPHLKQVVYCAALAEGGLAEWDFAWDAHHHLVSATERKQDDLLQALACTRKPRLLERYVQYMMDPSKNQYLDMVKTTIFIAQNALGESFAWNFLTTQWREIIYSYGRGSTEFGRLIFEVTKRFSTRERNNELSRFRLKLYIAGLRSEASTVMKALHRTRENIKWLEENKEEVLGWFKDELNEKLISDQAIAPPDNQL